MTLADEIAAAHAALLADDDALERLHTLRGWTREAIERLGIGIRANRARITIPVRDAAGDLVNVLDYAPNPERRDPKRKLIAQKGRPRDLFPAPETLNDAAVVLVEGEPDAVAGWSLGLPCVAIPGVGAKPEQHAARFTDRDVVILFDRDDVGPKAAEAWAKAIARRARRVRIATWPEHGDDMTEVLMREGVAVTLSIIAEATASATLVEPFRLQLVGAREFAERVGPRNPDNDLLGPLLRRGQRVVTAGQIGHGKTTITLQMVSAAAYGEPFLNWCGRPEGSRWLVVDLEQGESSVAKRLDEAGLSQRNGNVQIVSIPDGLQFDVNPDHKDALEEALAKGWDGVVLDPWYQLVDDEDEVVVARRLIRQLDTWRKQYGFCLIVPTHCRKLQPGQRFTMNDIYGRAVTLRNAEVILGIQRTKHGRAHLHWWKDRDGDMDVPLSEWWELTFDRHGLFQRANGVGHGQESLPDAA